MKTLHSYCRSYSSFIIGAALMGTLLSCSRVPGGSDAERLISDTILRDSGGRIRLLKFHKTNGVAGEVMGMKIYAMDVEFDIEFTENCKWLMTGLGTEISLATSQQSEPEGGALRQLLEASTNPGEYVKKGQQFRISGTIRYTKKEKGWAVDRLELKRSAALSATTSNRQHSSEYRPLQERSTSAVPPTAINQETSAVAPAEALEPLASPEAKHYEQSKAIYANLRRLESAKDLYILKQSKFPQRISFEQVLSEVRDLSERPILAVAGEDYSKALYTPYNPIVVTLPDGRQISSEANPERHMSDSELYREAVAIQTNLKAISSAAHEIFLKEGAPKSGISFQQLVPLLKSPIKSIAGEDYSQLIIVPNRNFGLKTRDGRIFTIADPPPRDPLADLTPAQQEKRILSNLRQLSAAADQFYLEKMGDLSAPVPTETSLEQLVGPNKYVREITSVAGEKYSNLRFRSGERLTVTTADGRVITFSPDP